MKVEINEKETQGEVKYPCLMKSEKGLIVLFNAPECGIVLKGNDVHERGHYSSNWNMDSFEPFNGTITLSNE
jgi:hypothetical protein